MLEGLWIMKRHQFATFGSRIAVALLPFLCVCPTTTFAQHHGGGHVSGGLFGGGHINQMMGGGNFYHGHGQAGRFDNRNSNGFQSGGSVSGSAFVPGYYYGQPWYGGGFGASYDAFGSMGMTYEEQQAIKIARYNEIMNRSMMEYEQGVQALSYANLAEQQRQSLLAKPSNLSPLADRVTTHSRHVAGLGEFVALGRVNWPKGIKASNKVLFEKRNAAEAALIAVQKDATVNGHPNIDKVYAAKEKLGLLNDAVLESKQIKASGKEGLSKFILAMDLALDHSLTDSSSDRNEKPKGASDPLEERLARNP